MNPGTFPTAGARFKTLLRVLCLIAGSSLLSAQGTGYWHTFGNQIQDANNQAVRIAGVNWYGFETPDAVAHGLLAKDYKSVLDAIKANGYNTVRLPFSNQVIESPIVPLNISYNNGSAINGDLRGLDSLQIMDKIVGYAGQIGLRIILDNHRSAAGSSAEGNGLWYTSAYPESAWINDWKALAARYSGNPTVIGADLRNEPHNANGGGACWGCGSSTNDWQLAARRAGNAVLGVNSNWLIFVEGTDCYGNDCYWWGGNLEGAKSSPVILNIAGRLVYSAHDYGPTEFEQSWFNSGTTTGSLNETWTKHWAYLNVQNIAPVWLGEFGTSNKDADIRDTRAGSEGQWFQILISFLHTNSGISWTYWALNGEDRYGLLNGNYDASPASALKQQSLSSVQFTLSSSGRPVTSRTAKLTPTPTLSPLPVPTPTTGASSPCHVSYVVNSQWNVGFNTAITIQNTGTTAVDGWILQWSFDGNQKITQAWNSNVSKAGPTGRLTNASWNGAIGPGASVSAISFNASYSGTNNAPTQFYLNDQRCQ